MAAKRARKWPPCPVSGKRRYRSHSDAVQSLHHAQGLRRHAEDAGGVCGLRIIRAYECHFCSGWHTTSQEQRGNVAA